MNISIRALGSVVAGGLMVVALGGAATSGFVLKTLNDFTKRWDVFTYNMAGPDIDALSGAVTFMQFLVLGGSVATISTLFLVGGFFMWFTNRKVVGPMIRLTDTMKQLAHGNTDVIVPYADSTDEIGIMAHSVGVMKENTIARLRLEEQKKTLEAQARADRGKEMQKIASGFEAQIGDIAGAVSAAAKDMRAIEEQLSANVSKTRTQSVAASSAADETTTNVQTIAAAAEELASSIREAAQTVNETAVTARDCAAAARESQAQLDGLSAAVHEIDAVIKAINDIAEQTNLLALNATIEAARAGEAGKGFAVVASEVKNLASQTGQMTGDITAKVDLIKQTAQTTIASINGIIQQIESVDTKTQAFAASVDSQNAATTNITHNIQRAATGTAEVSGSIQTINASAEESVAAAGTLRKTAHNLADGSKKLEDAVVDFLSRLRSQE